MLDAPVKSRTPAKQAACYHCGTPCRTGVIYKDERPFCCEGCELVYSLLKNEGLCNYYELQDHPGITRIRPVRQDKFAYLDVREIAEKLYDYTDGDHTAVTFYLPAVHCSSCMWLLERLPKINKGISGSRLNFSAKEVTVHFSVSQISLRQVAELLTTIGYEPYISLDDTKKTKSRTDQSKLYKLGVAGFAFGNIMMMSLPEYFSIWQGIEEQYSWLFRILNLTLALPVFFYSATEFFSNAWNGLKQRHLNIDVPVALAILITFVRSVTDMITDAGPGYLDSMSGIVFFMLVGRVVQERSYKSLSFERDYQSYFPVAVEVVLAGKTETKQLSALQPGDCVRLHQDELIPADGVLTNGEACIDYSFVSGESRPVIIEKGQNVYAGGRQQGGAIEVNLTQPVDGSYLTQLWNHSAFKNDKAASNNRNSVLHRLSTHFTLILLILVAITATYWAFNDPAQIWPSVTAMLIIACPCALLLAASFANGNMLRLLSNNGLFLRDATVIEQLGKIDSVVFDKTGTLTSGSDNEIEAQVQLQGDPFAEEDWAAIAAVTRQSRHPYSVAITKWLGQRETVALTAFREEKGKGVSALAGNKAVFIGNAEWAQTAGIEKANVYLRCGDSVMALEIHPAWRSGLTKVISSLQQRYQLNLLSGDNDLQKEKLKEVFDKNAILHFRQRPEDKLQFIASLQQQGYNVLMIGDGLNDAGALQQSNVGITLTDDVNNFTPACDAILDGARFDQIPELLRLARFGNRLIRIAFLVSICYNIIGLFFAVQGLLSPILAAILMPSSTLSIVLVTTGLSSSLAYSLGLKGNKANKARGKS